MNELLWAIGRTSGIVALVLFSASIVLGILTHRGSPLPGLPRFGVVIVHRNVSLLAAVFLVLHVLTLLGDSYAKLDLIDVVVPFLGSFQPFWQGLGTVAFDLILAVIVTSLLRHRIGDRAFRWVHWFVYAMWPIAVLHSIGNGTDGSSSWFVLVLAGCLIAVGSALIWRLSTRSARLRPVPPVGASPVQRIPRAGKSIR
jgi:sulfoxide reductase heme-binding subunit YedZ